VFGLLGDYWLDMKDMYPQHRDTYVFAGFCSFLAGHLFFIAGLYKTYAAYGSGIGWRYQLVVPAAGLAFAALVLATEKPMKLAYGKFKGITAAYSGVFGASVAMAFCCWYSGGRAAQPFVMFLGLAVFLLSDLVLSGTYFGKGKARPVDYILNYPFYYGVQFAISLSLLAAAQLSPPGTA
jgi:uncharacterized membrane protein YhhN